MLGKDLRYYSRYDILYKNKSAQADHERRTNKMTMRCEVTTI